MGCDGGTIPKRHELVKGPKKVEKIDKNAELVARWYYCTLSQEKLTKPVVACELGRLYNKDAVIEFLLDKSPDKPNAESSGHIKSLKNVIELNLSENPAWSGGKGNSKGDKYDDPCAQFICPVVGLEMNGRHRFCVLRRCGCVFSERALKEIKTDICHKAYRLGGVEVTSLLCVERDCGDMGSILTSTSPCGAEFQEDDLILLNGDKEEVQELRRKMEVRKLKSKTEKILPHPKNLPPVITVIPEIGLLLLPAAKLKKAPLRLRSPLNLHHRPPRDPYLSVMGSLKLTNPSSPLTARPNVQRTTCGTGSLRLRFTFSCDSCQLFHNDLSAKLSRLFFFSEFSFLCVPPIYISEQLILCESVCSRSLADFFVLLLGRTRLTGDLLLPLT
uniref:Replication termination factor 2 n=1 Tax=Leptobrachium leishanense TaxID=445787 RepID=A0A8C5QTE9_9ANUR